MDTIKNKLKKVLLKEIDSMDLESIYLTKDILEIKLNTLVENTLSKIELNTNKVPIYKTTNDNVFDGVSLNSEKSRDVDFCDFYIPIEPNDKPKKVESTTIPLDFSLTYELRSFAKSKFVQNIDDMFDDFKLYYQSKAITNSDWGAVWKRWVLNNNKYKSHLIKTTIKDDMSLTTNMKEFAKEYIDKGSIDLEFIKFKNHYLGTGDLKVSWDKVWENWCIHHKQFKPKDISKKAKEKQDYRWDFRKAKDVSDRIKDWLEFEKGINWLDDFYWKGIPIPGIGWQKVIHPDFNKEEILLYKIDSKDGTFMLNHKTDDIIDAEVLEVK
ncbi:MAG: hypothetical protein U9O56_01175 [Campylobacterota bacterium]|nr:hypothetical protein [Campylobacterota bacterium]